MDKTDEGGNFNVEKILKSKEERGQITYRVRWKGYGPKYDTWEPLANVASTGHVDRFVRRQRAKNLRRDTPGVAVIEYDDGEQELVDMRRETFRECNETDGFGDESDDECIVLEGFSRDFSIVSVGKSIELKWPHSGLGFKCKIISWVPIGQEIRAKENDAWYINSFSDDVDISLSNSEYRGIVIHHAKKIALERDNSRAREIGIEIVERVNKTKRRFIENISNVSMPVDDKRAEESKFITSLSMFKNAI